MGVVSHVFPVVPPLNSNLQALRAELEYHHHHHILILHLSVCDVRAGGHGKPFDPS